MDAASSTPTGTFDPFTQTMAWLTTYGPTTKPIEVTMEDLSFFWYQNMHLGLVYGSQLGLTTLMLVTLLLVTQPGKRRAPIYVLNVTALVLDLTRSTLMAVWLVSMWNHPVTIFARDYSRITRGDVANSVVVNVVKTLELGTVLCSLVFQIRVIMSTATSMQRASVLSAAFIIATATMCVQLASAVVNSRNIALFIPPEELGLQLRLADLARIMQVVNTGFLLLVFAARLGFAIKQRHKLGHSQFGPMQMVFIGSMQSMLIPVIFVAAQWKADGDFGSLAMTVLAIQLPLTALWASTSLEDRLNSAQQPRPAKQLPIAMRPTLDRLSDKETGSVSTRTGTSSTAPLSPTKGSISSSEKYRLDTIPMTTTIGSVDVEVKMLERDMV